MQFRPPTPMKSISALSRLFHVVLVLVRALAFLASFELSDASDVITVLVTDDDTCADCPLERPGDPCPPGCPSCHCWHAGIGLAPAAESTLFTAAVGDDPVAVAPYESAIPRAPPLPGVYRPPRQPASRS
jgi:hypothetical protein